MSLILFFCFWKIIEMPLSPQSSPNEPNDCHSFLCLDTLFPKSFKWMVKFYESTQLQRAFSIRTTFINFVAAKQKPCFELMFSHTCVSKYVFFVVVSSYFFSLFSFCLFELNKNFPILLFTIQRAFSVWR